MKAEHGLAITEVNSGSPAAQAGLATGMVITEVNRQPVKTVLGLPARHWRPSLSTRESCCLVRSAEGSRFVVIRAES